MGGILNLITNSTAIPVLGAIYTIIPNPVTGVGQLIVGDGNATDTTNAVSGKIVVAAVFGTYNVTMTGIPGDDIIVLTTSGQASVHKTNFNPTLIFPIQSKLTNLGQQPPTNTVNSPNN